MTYKFNIRETLEKVVEIEASNFSEAIHKVQEQYNNSEIELTAENMTGFEITEYED